MTTKIHPDAFYEWLKRLEDDFDRDSTGKWATRLRRDKRSVNEILSEDLGMNEGGYLKRNDGGIARKTKVY
jgi:hypothetical protein